MSKKLVTLAATALTLTIGGVYATWQYATGAVDDVTATNTVTIEAVGDATPKGEIKVESNTLTLSLDQTGTTDYTAKLVSSGEIVISYTPDTAHGSEADTIDLLCTISYSESTHSFTYDGAGVTALFTVNTATLEQTNVGGATQWTITAADFVSCITLSNVELSTLTKYNEFKDEVIDGGKPTFTLTFSEKTGA